MTPLADLEHGQGIVDSKLDSIVTPVDHVEPAEQGSMAPPVVISADNLIDFPNVTGSQITCSH